MKTAENPAASLSRHIHYGRDKDHQGVYTFAPQLYTFKAGRSYIVFAKKTESPTGLR